MFKDSILKKLSTISIVVLTALILCNCSKEANDSRIVFFDAEKGADVTEEGVTTELKNGELLVTTNLDRQAPGIVLNGNWRLPESSEILLVLTNHDDRPLSLRCRLESPNHPDSAGNFFTATVNIAPGETLHYRFKLPMKMPEAFKDRFFAMRDNPYMQIINVPY